MMDWVGRKVKVVFFDGERISYRVGELKSIDNGLVIISLSDTCEAIPIRRVIRMELVE